MSDGKDELVQRAKLAEQVSDWTIVNFVRSYSHLT